MSLDILEKIGDHLTAIERELSLVRHEQQRQGMLLASVLANCPRCHAQVADTVPPPPEPTK